MGIINEIRKEMTNQMKFQSELATKMSGNTKTRIKDLSNILSFKREPGTQLLEEIAEALSCEWKLITKKNIMIDYVIFDKGTDAYPDVYQVWRYENGKPDFSSPILHKNLDQLRSKLREKGMVCKGKGEYKHPLVIEVWIGEPLLPFEVL